MPTIADLFDVRYGHSLELNGLKQVSREEGIAFVSRKMGDNGISAYVPLIPDVEPADAGELSCALGGNGVLTTFLQEQPFYTGRDVARLIPRVTLTKQQLLFYALCIKANRFRYSYGRQANRSLKTLLVPSLSEVPDWVNGATPDMFSGAEAAKHAQETLPTLDTAKWKFFRYDEIFEIRKGYYNKKPPLSLNPTDVPFIGATEKRNGVTAYISMEHLRRYSRDGRIIEGEPMARKLFPTPCVTVSNNGSVGEAFFQDRPFTCSHDVNPLYLKDTSVELTPELGLFLATVIRAEKYRWGFGRKWRPIRMPSSLIKLPVKSSGRPDWEWMEKYINSLPFSSQL